MKKNVPPHAENNRANRQKIGDFTALFTNRNTPDLPLPLSTFQKEYRYS